MDSKSQREANGALWGVIFLIVNYALSIVSTLAAFHMSGLGYWRFITATVALVAALCYIRVFDRHFPVLSRLFVFLTVLGTGLLFYELFQLGFHVSDFAAMNLPHRYSQFVFPLGLTVLGIILWKDRRVPRPLSLGMFVESAFWFGYFAVAGRVDLQVKFAFGIDVLGFIVFLAFMVWLMLFWYAERRDPANDS